MGDGRTKVREANEREWEPNGPGETPRCEVADQANRVASLLVCTTLGEPVVVWADEQGQLHGKVGGDLPAGFPRYAYAGEHGYEHGLLALFGVNENLPPLTLLHVGERWYDPALGRFLQRDPIGLPGGLNAYAYCGANPLVFVDPSGLSSMMHPETFVVLIQQSLQAGGRVTVVIGGRVLQVYKVTDVFHDGQWWARFWYWENGIPKYWDWAWRTGQKIGVDHMATSGGCVFNVGPPPGACGATGLEAAPLLIAYLLLNKRSGHARSRRGQGTATHAA